MCVCVCDCMCFEGFIYMCNDPISVITITTYPHPHSLPPVVFTHLHCPPPSGISHPCPIQLCQWGFFECQRYHHPLPPNRITFDPSALVLPSGRRAIFFPPLSLRESLRPQEARVHVSIVEVHARIVKVHASVVKVPEKCSQGSCKYCQGS